MYFNKLLIVTFCGIITTLYAFNLDTVTYRRYRGDKGTMFGFSIALHKSGQRRVVLVGAPEAQTDQPGVTRGGAVYFCETNGESCGQLVFDSSGSNTHEGEPIDRKSYQWFGATVQSSGSIILACAPRYISFTNMKNRRDPVGTCWVARNGSLSGALEYSEYAPCRTKNWGYHRQGSCQAGLGAAVSRDGRRLFVGAVGSWYWQGMLVSQNLHARPDVISSLEGSPSDDDSYLGYSVAAADFSGGNSTHGDVAVGMPRGEGLRGKIVIFTWNMTILQNVTGEQLGAYFGYSVCACDVNGDGRQDLIVGAPLYTDANNEGKYETGRVYIYISPENYIFGSPIIRDGTNSKARFGLALTSAGDINKDGYEDFAVGAPYDGPEERGAVYLFHGSRTGVREKASQVVYSEELPGSPTTFGFSLSGGLDMDLNEYPDLAIGAYESDVAIFLRSRPVVKLDASVIFLGDGKQISLEERNCSLKDRTRVPCIQMRSCLSYGGIGVNQQLDFEVQFLLDSKKPKSPRMFFLSEEGRNVLNQTLRLERGQRVCKNNFVYLKTNFRDKLTSLDVEMRYSLIGDNLEFRRERRTLFPVLELSDELYKRDSISIQKNCGKDNICIPDLRLISSPSVKQYLLGSGERLNIDVLVQNEGEDAFEASFKLQVPPGLNYVNIERLDEAEREIPVQCSPPAYANNNTLHCDIGNPLPKEKLVHFKVILQPYHQEGMSPRYDFYMSVNSTNPENRTSLSDNLMHITVPIWVDSDLVLSGSSHPVEIHYNDSQYTSENISQETEIGPQVVHIYTIRNKGPSDILEAEAYFLWPSFTLAGDHLLYLLEQPETTSNIKCEFIPEINVDKIKIDRKRKSYLDGEGHSLGVHSGLSSATEESSSHSTHTSSSSSSSSSSEHWSSTSYSSSSSGTIGRDGKPLTSEEAKRIEELERKREEEEALKESGDGTNRYRSRTKNQGVSEGRHYSSNGGALESDSHSKADYDTRLYERGRVEVSRGSVIPGRTYYHERREHTDSGSHDGFGTDVREMPSSGGQNTGRTYYEERHSASNTTWRSGEPSVTRTSSSWTTNVDGDVRNGSTSNIHLGSAVDTSSDRRLGHSGGAGGRNYSEERHFERNVTWNSRDGGRPVVSESSSWRTDTDGIVRNGSSNREYEREGSSSGSRDHLQGSHRSHNQSWSSSGGRQGYWETATSQARDSGEIGSSSSRHHVSGGGSRHSSGGHRDRYNEERHHRVDTSHRGGVVGATAGRETDFNDSSRTVGSDLQGRNRTFTEERRREWNSTWSSSDEKPKTTEFTSWRREDDGVVRSGSNIDTYEGQARIDPKHRDLLDKHHLHVVHTDSGSHNIDENIARGGTGRRVYSEESETSYNTTWNSASGNKPVTRTSTAWKINEDGVVRSGSSSDVYEGTAPPIRGSGVDVPETERTGSRRQDSGYESRRTNSHSSRTSSSSESDRRSGSRTEHSGSERTLDLEKEYERRGGTMSQPARGYDHRREHSSGTHSRGSSSTGSDIRRDNLGSETDYERRDSARRDHTDEYSRRREHSSSGGYRRGGGSSSTSDSRTEYTSSGVDNERAGSRREGYSNSSYNVSGGSRNLDSRSGSSGGFDFGAVAQGPRDGVARTYTVDLGLSDRSSDSGSSRSGSRNEYSSGVHSSASGSRSREHSSTSDFERGGSRRGYSSSDSRYGGKDEDDTYSRREQTRHSSSSHISGGSSSSGSSGAFDLGAVAQGPKDGVARTYTVDLGVSEGSSASGTSNRGVSSARGHEASYSSQSSGHRSSGGTTSHHHGNSGSHYSSENQGYSSRHNDGDYDLGARHGSSLSSRHYSTSRHYSSGGSHSSSGRSFGSEDSNREGSHGGGGGYHESYSWSSTSGTADGDDAKHGGAYGAKSISNEETRGKFQLYPRYKRQTQDGSENLKESLQCGPTKCTKIKCNIGALKNDEEAMVAFRSRVWVRTIKKLSSSMEVHVSSMVAAKVTKLPHIGTPDVVTTHTHEIHSQIMPTEAAGKPDYVPLWVVVLSACAGAIILMLLVYLLYKCGFFKRNRPSNAPEKQPLNRNGHYNGDEAL